VSRTSWPSVTPYGASDTAAQDQATFARRGSERLLASCSAWTTATECTWATSRPSGGSSWPSRWCARRGVRCATASGQGSVSPITGAAPTATAPDYPTSRSSATSATSGSTKAPFTASSPSGRRCRSTASARTTSQPTTSATHGPGTTTRARGSSTSPTRTRKAEQRSRSPTSSADRPSPPACRHPILSSPDGTDAATTAA